MISGGPVLNAYCSGVPSTGFHCGLPPSNTTGVGWVSRCTVAVCGIWLAIAASLDCGVPATEISTSDIGCSGGIFAKSAGSFLLLVKVHGPVRVLALNQRQDPDRSVDLHQ